MRRKLSRQDAIYSIALAGISAGMALLLVWLGVITKYTTIAFFIAASLAILVPMTRGYYLSSLIAYGVSAGLSFLIVGDIVAVSGYIVYFGPMGLLTGLLFNLKVKLWIQTIIKAVCINGLIPILYFVFKAIILTSDAFEVKYYIVAIVSTIVLLAIDFVVMIAYKRISKIMDKVLRNTQVKEKEINDDNNDDNNPFDGTFEG